MSSVIRPRGPQKQSVYWRRRLVAAVVVIGVPLVLVLIIASMLSGDPDPQAQPQPQQSGAPGQVEPTPEPEPEPEPEPDAGAEGEPCADRGIAVGVALDAEVYPSNTAPEITMTITNASGLDCLRDIGPGANEIIVTSGGHHVWSSDDCDPSKAVDEQLLPAGADAETTLTWERILSAPGCSGSGADAKPGTYMVEGRNGSVVSEPVRFLLQ